MIPSVPALRHAAGEAWKLSTGEDEYRTTFVASWSSRINTAYVAGEITDEGLRLAFDAVLSPITYRRRFGRLIRMTLAEARAELAELDIVVSDAMVPTIARDYGIDVILEEVDVS